MDLMKLMATLPLPEKEHKHLATLMQSKAKGGAGEVKGLLKQMKEDQEDEGNAADESEQQAKDTSSRMGAKLAEMLAQAKKTSAEAGQQADKCQNLMVEAQMDVETNAAAVKKHTATLADAKKALGQATVAHNEKQA